MLNNTSDPKFAWAKLLRGDSSPRKGLLNIPELSGAGDQLKQGTEGLNLGNVITNGIEDNLRKQLDAGFKFENKISPDKFKLGQLGVGKFSTLALPKLSGASPTINLNKSGLSLPGIQSTANSAVDQKGISVTDKAANSNFGVGNYLSGAFGLATGVADIANIQDSNLNSAQKRMATADSGVNTISNVASAFGPYGAAIGAGLQLVNSIGGSLIGTPKAIKKFNINENVANTSAFGGVTEAANEAKATGSSYQKAGLFGKLFGGKNRILKDIRSSNAEQTLVSNEVDKNKLAMDAAANSAALTSTRNANRIAGLDSLYYNGGLQFGKDGAKIHIKKSHRGLFTAKAKRAGMGVQAFASKVLANKENFSSSTVKQANFAKNATKFKHQDGGILEFQYGGLIKSSEQDNTKVVTSKLINTQPIDKDITPKLRKYLGDASATAFDKILKENGNPKITRGKTTLGARASYNPLNNSLTLKSKPSEDDEIEMAFIENNRKDVIAEIAHAKQFDKGVIKPAFKWLTNDLPAYIQGKNPYHTPGTLEHDAHAIIEPKLQAQYKSLVKVLESKPSKLKVITEGDKKLAKGGVLEFKDGGTIKPKNVIVHGKLHAHKHTLKELETLREASITAKGIPVITMDAEGGVLQHSEVETGEVVLHLELTQKLEELRKEGTEEAAFKAGKLLARELMKNTKDKTGTLRSIKESYNG